MANDNKTFAGIVKRVRRECNSYPLPNAAGEKLKLVREMEDAHNREIVAKNRQLEAVSADAEAADAEIDAKDAEIENLKKENDRLRVINCGNYYADEQLRGELAEKDEEIARLRALVGKLTDALDSYPCHNCKHGSERCEWCGTVHELDALVAKAREVVK